tara:strand:- start:129 stop:308 length:180 start_codon:yes stop_codon:yes gene_type:complete
MEGSLKAEKVNKLIKLLSSGKYEFPINGQELYIVPASIPDTKAPIIICKKIINKKKEGK